MSLASTVENNPVPTGENVQASVSPKSDSCFKPETSFYFQKNVLEEKLAILMSVLGKSTLPILNNVLFSALDGKLELTGTDLNVSIRAFLDCTVKSQGKLTVPGRMLYEFLKALKSEIIQAEPKGSKLRFYSQNSRMDLACLNPDDFPETPPIPLNVPVQAAVFASALRKTIRASSGDESRHILCGVMVEIKPSGLTVVATDGRRLHLVLPVTKIEGVPENGIKAVLPNSSVDIILKILGQPALHETQSVAQIGLSEKGFGIRYGNFELMSRVIDGNYPEYQKVVPAGQMTSTTVNKEILMAAVKRVRLADHEHNSLILSVSEKELRLSAGGSSLAESEDIVPVESFNGQPLEICINSSYLLDALDAVAGKSVQFLLNRELDPVKLIDSEFPSFLSVMMPIRK